MLLGLLPMATFAVDTETTLPQVTLSVDKTTVEAGDDITLTLTLDKDVDTPVANWQWNFVWNSDYFTAKSSAIGTSVTPLLESMPVTPIVNLTAKTYFASPYKAASVTAGNTLTPHYLKAGTIASVTLTATKDIPEGENAKFFVTQAAQIGTSGNEVVVTQLDPTKNWGSNTQTLPDDSVGLIVTAPVASVDPIDITVYYADNGKIVTSDKDGETLLNFATVHVADMNDDGKLTMYDGFACLHEQYHTNGVSGYTDNNWVTQFWSVETAMVSYGHNNRWVFSTAEEIADGDSLCLFTYQDQNSWSDLYTYFDSLTATATAGEEKTFHVNGYSFFGSGSNMDAITNPVGATVTATCGDETLTTTTDAEGNFKLTFPTAGDWTVLVNGTCSYTCDVGYYAGQTYTNAPVTPAQMTVTVAEAAYVAPDPVKVSVYYSKGLPNTGMDIVKGKDGTVLNYVTLTVSDKDSDGKLTINDAFIVLHETYYTDGASGYSRADGSSTFWGIENTNPKLNPFIFLNHAFDANSITVDTEIKEGDKICAFNQASPQFPYAYFDDGVTGTATAGKAATFHITGNRTDGKHTLSGATVTATCGETTVTGTNDENGNVVITFPSAGTYTLVVSGTPTLDGEDTIPIQPAMMTVTVAEAQVDPEPTDPEPTDPDPTESGYTVTLDEEKTVNVGETVSIDVKVGHTDEKVETYNAFDMTFSYDATVLTLTSTEIEGLTVTTGDGTVRVQGYGADKAIGSTAFTLTFAAKATGNATVDVTTAKVDAAAHAIDKDAPEVVEATGTSVTVSGYPVTLPDNFTGEKTAEPGKDYTFSEPEDYYDYDVKATVDGEEVTVTDNGDGSYTIKAEDVTGEIKVTATKTGKTFHVTLGTDMTGESTAVHGTDYTATLNKRDGFTYEVSVTMGGKAYTGYSVSEGVYTIPGADITGDIVFTVTRTGVEGYEFTVTVEGTGAGDVTLSANKVNAGGTLTFSVNMENGYAYEVAITMGGQAAGYQKYGSDYTITSVTGDVVITVDKTLDLSNLQVYEYVQLDGKTVFLVHVVKNLNSGKALTYDGNAMFYGRYQKKNSWTYLVIVDKDTTFTAEDAKAKIAVAETSYTTLSKTSTDVNCSGLTDINDAQLVYDIYNGKYDSFDTVTMEKFLYADVNNDKTVNVSDAAAVVAAIG